MKDVEIINNIVILNKKPKNADEAMRLSVKKWKEIRKHHKKGKRYIEFFGSSSCGLCQYYSNLDCENENGRCPVYQYTGIARCKETPWEKYYNRCYFGGTTKNLVQYAKKEYEFLRMISNPPFRIVENPVPHIGMKRSFSSNIDNITALKYSIWKFGFMIDATKKEIALGSDKRIRTGGVDSCALCHVPRIWFYSDIFRKYCGSCPVVTIGGGREECKNTPYDKIITEHDRDKIISFCQDEIEFLRQILKRLMEQLEGGK